MKNIITLSICLLAITSSFASNFADLTISKKGDNSKMEITLTLNDVMAGEKLFVKDEDGTLLFNKTIEKTGKFNNRFDLSELPNGVYHFEHEKEHYVKHIPFTVSYGQVSFDSTNEKFVYKPNMRVNNNHIYLSKLDLDKGEVEVDIYYAGSKNKEYKLLYTENITDTVKVEKAYRLSAQHKGDYMMVVKANGKSYVENFKI